MSKLKRGRDPLLVVVYTTHSYEEAHIIAGRLQSEGIPAMIDREAAGGAIGITVGPLGEVRVLVREEHDAIARAILDGDDHPQLDETTDTVIYHLDVDDDVDDEEDNHDNHDDDDQLAN